jgi:hypothetical protein
MNRKNQAKKLEDTSRRAAEAMEAARMKRCGLTLKQIGANLGCSLQKAHVLVHEGIDAYREQAREEIKAWTEGAIAELLELKQEVWIQWQRSKEDRQKHVVKNSEDGREDTDTTEGQCADARYSAEIRGCIESIGKLLGVIGTNINVGVGVMNPQGESEISTYRQQVASMLGTMIPPSIVEAYFEEEIGGKQKLISTEHNGNGQSTAGQTQP